MKYSSTRGGSQDKGISAAQAIKQGLATDGGLFLPEEIPQLSRETLISLCKLSYAERAAKILGMYLTDYTEEELLADCRTAYGETRFPGGAAPIVTLADSKTHILELWHGPTCAFKDMALQIMPRLLSRALGKTGESRTALILVATSGDTGKAALEGYRDVNGVKIAVFYPAHGVSKVQKLQMATQEGKNVFVAAIEGNFDDAQTGVKRIFSDAAAKEKLNENGLFLSSANSINWGRLVPQIVYYISAYCDLVDQNKIAMGDTVDVCVPTGNFGNLFAAYLAKQMGLPLGRFLCASNQNHILTDFLQTGTYDRNRPFYTTMSPSMDILISSNLERLLCMSAGVERTVGYMQSLATTGCYTVDADIKEKLDREFVGYYCDEAQTAQSIRDVYASDGYVSDPHTAVALGAVAQDRAKNGGDTPVIVASTASPYKFAADVYTALTATRSDNEVTAIADLSAHTGTSVPAPLFGIDRRTVRFDPSATILSEAMLESVYGELGI